jgi:hypothetical protein
MIKWITRCCFQKMKVAFYLGLLLSFALRVAAQDDTADVEAVRRMVNLSEVVVRSDLNVPKFLQRIKNDTTFYKAFRNLRVLSFTSLNDIRMLTKKGAPLPPCKAKRASSAAAAAVPWMCWTKKQPAT